MGVVRVEPEPAVGRTECECGGTSRLVRGYVYEDERPFGMYFVEWCDGPHPERAAFVALGLGDFGDGSSPADRMAFGLRWTAAGMGITSDPVRDRPELLGRFVAREQALRLPDLDRLWHVADHIVLDDPRLARLRQWLEGSEAP